MNQKFNLKNHTFDVKWTFFCTLNLKCVWNGLTGMQYKAPPVSSGPYGSYSDSEYQSNAGQVKYSMPINGSGANKPSNVHTTTFKSYSLTAPVANQLSNNIRERLMLNGTQSLPKSHFNLKGIWVLVNSSIIHPFLWFRRSSLETIKSILTNFDLETQILRKNWFFVNLKPKIWENFDLETKILSFKDQILTSIRNFDKKLTFILFFTVNFSL